MATKKNKQEACVAIRLSSSTAEYKPGTRYLSWIDDNWYGTANAQLCIFPVSKIQTIKEQLKQHFLYFAAFVNEDGSEEIWSSFAERKKAQPKVKFKPFNGISFFFKKKHA